MDLSLLGQSREAEGRHRAALPVLAPGSALGSRPRVALSSAQVFSVYLAGLWLGNSLSLVLARRLALAVASFSPRGPDRLRATGQLVGRRDVGDRAMQPHRVVVGHALGDQPPSVLRAQRGLNADASLLSWSCATARSCRCFEDRRATFSHESFHICG